jgi:hypothetical protein
LDKRLAEHERGEGANYTADRLPVELIYYEEYDRIDDAFYREKPIQGWTRLGFDLCWLWFGKLTTPLSLRQTCCIDIKKSIDYIFAKIKFFTIQNYSIFIMS